MDRVSWDLGRASTKERRDVVLWVTFCSVSLILGGALVVLRLDQPWNVFHFTRLDDLMRGHYGWNLVYPPTGRFSEINTFYPLMGGSL